MEPILAALTIALAAPAFATPMLQKCRALAPAICALTDRSTNEEILSCFETNGGPRNTGHPDFAACAEELAHARVHKACDAKDIPAVCPGVKPGNDRVMTCLRTNAKKLGPDCAKQLEAYDALKALDSPSLKGKRRKGRHSAVAEPRC